MTGAAIVLGGTAILAYLGYKSWEKKEEIKRL